MIRVGRMLFLIGFVLLLFVFLLEALVYQTTDNLQAKILAVIGTTLLIWFADAGSRER